MKFISIARRVLAHKLDKYSLIDVVNAIIEMEELSSSIAERAEWKLSYVISKMNYKIYQNFDVTEITDSNEDLIEFFGIRVNKGKIGTLLIIGDIDHIDGVVNQAKG